jgi:membrane protease YdiL (CAAX protease family)
MAFLPPLDTTECATITAFSTTILGFLIYWFTSTSKKLEERVAKRLGENYSSTWVISMRVLGFLSLGVMPGAAMWCFAGLSPVDLGLKAQFSLTHLWWVLGIGALLVPINIVNAKKPVNLATYPQIRNKVWSPTLVVVSALTWLLYLFGYEFLFRGVLFLGVHESIGVWPAIALNACIYSAVHIPKGIGEAIGALPFGVVICLVTLSTGDIWVAFLAHGVLALSNEWSSLYHQKGMRIGT